MLRSLPLFACLFGLAPTSVFAQACPDEVAAWAEACGDVHVRVCPPGHAIFDVGAGHLGVDVSLAPEGAFASAGGLGASPLGNYPDWDDAPAVDRAAFEQLVACMGASSTPLRASLEHVAESSPPELTAPHASSPERTAPRVPWPLVIALLLLGVLVQRLGPSHVARRLALPFAVGLGTFVLRRVLVSDGYFHQNGQGPIWVGHALGEPSEYGPGYGQVFGWIAWLASDPDLAVFLTQGLLGGLGVAAVYILGERIGGSFIAWGLALAAATSPILARLSGSESYFGAQASLLVVATAILVVTSSASVQAKLTASGGSRWLWLALGPLAAGALLAEVALVHPIAWVAAALVPSALLVLDGAPRARLGRTLGSALVCGAVVIAMAAPAMLAVLEGRIGETWIGPANDRVGGSSIVPLLVVWGLVVPTVLIERTRRAVPLVLLVAVITTLVRTDMLTVSMPYAHHAHAALFMGPVAACIAASAPRVASGRAPLAFALVVLGLALGWHAATASDGLYRATDALEGDLFRAWRAELSDGAVVAHLEVADRHVLTLPLRQQTSVRLRADEPAPDLAHLGPDVYWYRSGICTTAEGRAYCEDLERRYVLTPLHVVTLPARPSLAGLDYDRDEVVVGLYRVESASPDEP